MFTLWAKQRPRSVLKPGIKKAMWTCQYEAGLGGGGGGGGGGAPPLFTGVLARETSYTL